MNIKDYLPSNGIFMPVVVRDFMLHASDLWYDEDEEDALRIVKRDGDYDICSRCREVDSLGIWLLMDANKEWTDGPYCDTCYHVVGDPHENYINPIAMPWSPKDVN